MTTKTRSIGGFRGEALSLVLRIAYTGLAFLVTVLLARLLGPAPLGRYFEAIAWVLLIGGIVQSGWTPFLVREVAALRESKRLREAAGIARLAIRMIFAISAAAAILLVALAWVTGTDSETMTLLAIGAPIVVLLATSTAREAITRAMGWTLLGQICESLTRPGVQLVGLLCFWTGVIGAELTPAGAITIFLVAVATSAALAYALERRATTELRRAGTASVPPRSEWAGSFLQNALIGWSTAINLQIGTLILANAAGDAEIADFRIAQQLALLMVLGLSAVGTFYAPSLSRSFARGEMVALQKLATRASLFSLLAALPLALIYFLFGDWLIVRLFGPEYAGALAPLMVLTIGQLANTAFGAVTAIAVATRNESAALRAHAASALCNIVLGVALVPALGAVGAAAASAASLTLWNLLIFVHLKRRLGLSAFLGLGGLKAQSGSD